MKLYLGQLPYYTAIAIIEYCWANDIDREQCSLLMYARKVYPIPDDLEWTLTIPEKHLTYILLKWNLHE